MSGTDNIDQLIEFPVIYSFKIIGDNSDAFRNAASRVFCDRADAEISERPSSGGKFISITATTEVCDKDDIVSLYAAIKALPGIKYWL